MSNNETGYNGWRNYETWNVALWIDNEPALYRLARSLRNRNNPYSQFAQYMFDAGSVATPDGVCWNDPQVDTEELDSIFEDM